MNETNEQDKSLRFGRKQNCDLLRCFPFWFFDYGRNPNIIQMKLTHRSPIKFKITSRLSGQSFRRNKGKHILGENVSLSLSFKKGETKHVPTNVDLDFLPTITRAPSLLRLDYFRSQRRRRTMTPKELTDYRRRRRCDTVISNTLGPVPDLDDVIWIYFSLIKKRKKIAEAAIRTR